MSDVYFGEREFGLKPRTKNEIDANVWSGLVALIDDLIDKDYFAQAFPQRCPDFSNSIEKIYETNQLRMTSAILGSFPTLKFPLDVLDKPVTSTILEFIEFCHEHMGKPVKFDYHAYYTHNDLSFDKQKGQREFRSLVNRLFQRNGIIFELQENGQVTRLAPPIVSDILNNAIFQTNDKELDSLLETARVKYLNPNLKIRLESLEKLWDAWERIKTLDYPSDKKKSIEMRLDQASSDIEMRKVIDDDGKKLTEIGNKFMIRHTEVKTIPITSSAYVDYLFHRMFAIIYLLLGNQIGKKLDSTVKEKIREVKPAEEMPF
ncbi:MAG TPA: hypothetical protein VE944_26980 [Nostoc sp.]|uniref:AbiJ-NTD4 domain-containing protein n=1 Tax=Nostoc sp. TaxID=1180 RepID=UPI002D221563|nr:hypothetical protein [Nostoc sp.]HYX17939.1 hypothetical protein [Nostoc sp.]